MATVHSNFWLIAALELFAVLLVLAPIFLHIHLKRRFKE